jgi:hypothetical protein
MLREHSAAIAFHRRVVACEQLDGEHPFELVLGSDAEQTREARGQSRIGS